jgi:hypothetical protein
MYKPTIATSANIRIPELPKLRPLKTEIPPPNEFSPPVVEVAKGFEFEVVEIGKEGLILPTSPAEAPILLFIIS